MNGLIITCEKALNRTENSMGSSRIRGRWLAKYWPELEEWTVGRHADFMIYQKVFWETHAQGFDGIKILDICDPDFLPEGDRMQVPHNVFKFIDMVDAVVTSTEALRDYIKMLAPKKIVRWIKDRKDLTEFVRVKKDHARALRNIVWYGYEQNLRYLKHTFSMLKDEGLELTIYTEREIELSGDYTNVSWKKYDFSRMNEELITYDAALFPCDRGNTDLRGLFKSDNKTSDCWALGIPVIQTVADIERFKDKEERVRDAKEKYDYAIKEYDIKKSVEEYKELLKEIKVCKKKK